MNTVFLASFWSWLLHVLEAANLLPHFNTPLGVFCAIAWTATLICIVMFIFAAIADMADGADAADEPGAIDGDAGLFSTRAIIAFILGFGWGGYLTVANGGTVTEGILVALAVGIGMFFLVAMLMRFIYGLRSDGTTDYRTLVGMQGTVYVTIEPNGAPGGQVQVNHPSQFITMPAVQDGSEPLPAHTRIEVVEATPTVLTVRPVSKKSQPQT